MNVTLISVPYDQERPQRGMGRAPAAFRAAGLAGRLAERRVRLAAEREAPGRLGRGKRLERLGNLLAAVAGLVAEALAQRSLPVILGGDCLNGIAVCAGLRRALGAGEFGIAWFDAHGDFNTPETTLSGYLGGMPLACACGRGLETLRAAAGLQRPADERRVLLLGARQLDPAERELLERSAVTALGPSQVRSGEIRAAARRCLAGAAGFYLHLDLDVLDPREAPGVAFPYPAGLAFEEVLRAARALRQEAPLAAVTLSAIDPEKDPTGQTVDTAIRLLLEILAPA